jgi:hypothetical protein
MAIYHTLTRTVKENPQTGSIISDAIMDPETLGKGVKMFAEAGLCRSYSSACRQQ